MPRENRGGAASPDRFGDGATGSRSSVNGIFRKEGDYWTVGYGNSASRLKDTKGFAYLAHLLRHPRIEFHVLDLAGGIASQRDDDDKEREDVEHAEQAQQKIDAVSTEPSRAVGIRGPDPRAGSASERARNSIGKSVKSVLERIAQCDAALGVILARSIKTGTFCSYQPDHDFPIVWEFAVTDTGSTFEPVEQPSGSADSDLARANHPKAMLTMLNVSPFSLAERTAFVGRESEGSAIRATIDRALTGHGSLVMLWDGPGVGKTRLAMEMAEHASGVGFRCSFGHCYEREEPFPYLPFAEIIEGNLARAASLDDSRRRIGDNAAELAQIAPRLPTNFPRYSATVGTAARAAAPLSFPELFRGAGPRGQNASAVTCP
jgi:AAA ATPase-like protein